MIERPDYSMVPEGGSVISGKIYSQDGKPLGDLETKQYDSSEDYGNNQKMIHRQENGPKPLRWKEFDREILPDQRWRIKHLIPAEGYVIIAAPSGEKKTWVAMEIARSVASGTSFLGHGDFTTEQGNVLYIDQEMSKSESQRRGRLLGLHTTDNDIWFLKADGFKLNDADNVEWLKEFVNENDIKVVIIDTLRAVAGGLREEKAEEVREFFDRFIQFKDSGLTLIFLDHCRKPSNFEGKKPKKEQLFASQDKLASVEVLLMLKSEERNDEIQIHQLKNRSGKEYKPFKLQMEESIDPEIIEPTPINIKMVYTGEAENRELKIDAAKDYIANILSSDGGKTRQELIKYLQTHAKIGSKNTSNALRELEQENVITGDKKGRERYYRIETTGSDENVANIGSN